MAVATYEDLAKSGYGTRGFGAGDQGITFADLGTYGLISSKYGPLQAIDAPLSNKGNATSQISGTTNTFSVSPQTAVRLVNNATGEVVFEGTGYEAAQTARDLAQGLSDTGGNKANWDIQAAAPGMSNFATVANDKPNKSAIGTVADIGLPILASALVPGGGFLGTILPAAAGSAVSSVAQGRSLGDTLLRAAMAGGGAGLGEGLTTALSNPLSNAAIQKISDAAVQNAVNAGASAASGALSGAFGSAAGSAAGAAGGSAAGGLTDDIIVNAIMNKAGSTAGSLASSALSSLPTLLSEIASSTPTVDGPTDIEDIIVNAPSKKPLVFDPGSLAGSALASLPNLLSDIATSTPPVGPDAETPTTFGDEIIVNARKYTPPVAPPIFVPPGILPPSTPPTTPPEAPAEKPPGDKSDVLGTGLSVAELATLASLGVSGLSSLFGSGGGGAGSTTPYVSPFGTGTGFGTGMDYRAQPAIADYERYGFGPEATFFRPEYNRLISSAAAPAATTTPTYQPLI